jgi:hypothetical protein
LPNIGGARRRGHGPLPHGIWSTLVAAISQLADRAEILHH